MDLTNSAEGYWLEWMHQSYLEGMKSQDPSTQNGALLVTAGYSWPETNTRKILARGHNHFPEGISEGYWHGEKQDKYDRVVHAEVAAILDAARRGVPTFGAILVCGWAACANCAKHIADAGISALVRHSFEQNTETTGNIWHQDCIVGDSILKESGVDIIEIKPIPLTLLRNGRYWRP